MPSAPNSYNQAMASDYSKEWEAAMDEEVKDQEKLQTSAKISKDEAGHEPLIPMRWVFADKLDPRGYITRFKVRLVVRGDQQPEDGEDTYAATLRARTLRLMMALCCLEDLETAHYDVKTALLYNKLRELVFCYFPQGRNELGHYLKLLKRVYGLRTAPKLWYEELTEFFKKLGTQQLVEDTCVMVFKGVIVYFFVDGIVMSRCLGELRWFLGIEVIRDRGKKKLWLSQASYLSKLAKKFHIEDDHHILGVPQVPLTTEELLPYEKTAFKEEVHLYHGMA